MKKIVCCLCGALVLGLPGTLCAQDPAQQDSVPVFSADATQPTLPVEAQPVQAGRDDLVSINFQDADITQVVKVLGDLTGTVILAPDELKGKITVVSLEKVRPETVVSVLESALMMRGYTVVKTDESLKIVPMPETKQTNVSVHVGTLPADIRDQDVVITQVMPLKYSSAVKIKNDLQTLIGRHGNILANERTNTLVVTDTAANIRRLATIIEHMERRLPPTLQVRTFILNYADATRIAEILTNLSKKDDTSQPPIASDEVPDALADLELYGEIQANVETETNAVIVATAPVNFPAIEQLVKKLDVFPLQAMIEAIIVDVTLDDTTTMGAEIGTPDASTSTTEGIRIHGQSDDKYAIAHSLLGLATDASTKGFTYRLLNEKETFSILGFILKTREKSKVLSTPKVLASNNQESQITVGQEIPIIESSVTDVVNNITTVNFKYEDVGLQLKVTPRISRDNYVNMKIHAEFKDLSPKTLFDASIINKREADATVIVPDGYTVVLGGLMRDNDAVVEDKVPLLGDIPLLGHLFKKTRDTTVKSELLIFLTPRVIRDKSDLERITTVSRQRVEVLNQARTKKEIRKAIETYAQEIPENASSTLTESDAAVSADLTTDTSTYRRRRSTRRRR
jgi:general secretion pathway protein D